MNHEIKHALRRIGRGTASYMDEKMLTDYIKGLEQSEAEMTDAYETAAQRANDLSTEVSRLRKQLAGPGAAHMIFLPGGRSGDDLHMAHALREVSDAVLRKVGQQVETQEAAEHGDETAEHWRTEAEYWRKEAGSAADEVGSLREMLRQRDEQNLALKARLFDLYAELGRI